jgi:hypothetical protein
MPGDWTQWSLSRPERLRLTSRPRRAIAFHWIKLRVSARSLRVAIAKFQAYLDQANPDWSREEFNAVNSAAKDDFEVADYEYKFDESDVRQLGVVEGPAPNEVEMVGSGANGC